MKNKLKFFTLIIFSLLFVSVSCSNPIANEDVISSRTARNSTMLVFDIGSKDNCGVTEPQGEVSYKIGNKYEIFFTENDGFQFDRWEVVNKNTGKVYNDVISIEDKKNPETTITILKSVDNVLLRAVGKVRPNYISTFPEYIDTGVFCDSIIVINFDKKISENSFYYSEEDLHFITADELLQNDDGRIYGYIFNGDIHYKNISITSSSDENLLSFFNPPILENGTILKLAPKKDNPLLTSAATELDIDVFILPDVFDEEGVSIGGDGIQWRYKINSQTDITPPEFSSFNLFAGTEKLVPGQKFVPENHVQNTISYDYIAIDKESGINFIKIEIKRLKTPDGIEVEEEPYIDIIKNDSSEKNQLELLSEDGLFEITFSLFDYSGNESVKNPSYLVAKDTTVDTEGIFFFNNQNYKDGDKISKKDLINSAKTIKWSNNLDDVWNEKYSTPADNLSYKLFWGTEKDKLISSYECKKETDYSNGVWSYTIPSITSLEDTFIRLEISDSLGNKAWKESVIPAVSSYYTYQKLSEPGELPAHYRIFYSLQMNDGYDANCEFGGFLYYSEPLQSQLKVQTFVDRIVDEDGTIINEKNTRYTDIYVSDISKCTFYFQLAYITESSCLVSLENKFSIIETNTISAPVVDSISIEKGAVNSKKNIASITYKSEPSEETCYEFFWGTEPDKINNYEQNSVFEIDSGIEILYYKTVCVNSSQNLSKTSEISSYNIKEFDYDTIPPVVKNYQCICNYQKTDEYTSCDYYPVITCDICYDNYEINSDGKAEYLLYTVPVDSPNVSFEELAEDDIFASPCSVNYFVPPSEPEQTVMVWNNIEGVSESESYFYVLFIEDAEENYSFFPLSYNKQLLEKKPVITFVQNEDDSELVDILFQIEKEDKCKDYKIEYSIFGTEFDYQNFEVCSTISETENEMGQILTLNKGIYSTVFTNKKDSFYFGFAKALYQNKKSEVIKYTYPVYFYTGIDDDVNCELKDVIDDMNGAQIYCDRPCLVMTYWSSENYEYSAEAWEMYGVQSNPLFVSAKNSTTGKYEDTFKFYKLDRENIPMGKYFVIIVHFADGTTKMSKTINTN